MNWRSRHTDGVGSAGGRRDPVADTHDTHDPPDEGTPGELIQLPCQPDRAVMADMVATLFRHSVHGLIEFAWTTPAPGEKARAKLNSARLFGLDDDSREALVEFAANLSTRPSFNLYISVGLRREDVPRAVRHGRDALLSVAAIKADCDTPGCLTHALAICEELHIRPSYVMFTGRYPHLRGSLWWVLDQPAGLGDFPAIEALERRLAQLFGSDTQVVDPSRVMRLAGSVAWPIKKDRTLEMTGAYAPPTGTRAAPYTLEELAHRTQAPAIAPMSPAAAALDLSGAKATHEYSALVAAAREPHNWHKSARDLTGHLIGRGCPPDVVLDMLTPALTQPGYTAADTRADLSVMVAGAMRKGWAPDSQEALAAVAARGPKPSTKLPIELVSFEALQSRDPPEWQISGIMPEKSFGYVYGKSGTFKTFITLDLALSIAFGRPWQNRAVKQGKVVYILGEGQGAFAHRVRAWQAARGLAGQNCEFWTIFRPIRFTDPADVGNLIAATEAAGVTPDWVFVDTVQRNFGAGDPDKTQDMTVFVNAVDAVRERFDCGVFAVHHAGKDLSKGARNSSVLYASADFEMRSEREEGDPNFTLVSTKTKDWEDFGRMRLGTESQTVVDERTGEIVTSLVVKEGAVRPEDDGFSGSLGVPAGRIEQLVMAVMVDGGSLTFRELIARTGENKGSLSRALTSLRVKRCIDKDEMLGLHYIREQKQ